jgi:hypothetical protein
VPPLLVIARESLAELAQRFANAMKPEDAPRPVPGAGPVMAPAAEPGTLPRSQFIPYGYNTGQRPRAGTGLTLTPFEQLRAMADFDLVRACIEDVRSQVRGMPWEIRLRPDFKGQEQQLQGRIAEVRAFCEAPDALAGIEWPEFCGSIVEEILVTDALTLLPRRDLGGRLIGVEQIDGATIIPLVDDRGRPPLPPAPAFEQIIHGVVETQFRLGEILYLPRNRKANSPYGRSCVENVLFAANLAIRNNLYDLSFFTAGNMPDGGFWKCPDDWSPDDIDKAQTRLNDLAMGNSDQRSGYLKLMPGGQYVSTKDRKWDYEFMEWLARVIAWGFGVSPIPIAKQMNRSVGVVMEQSALEAGTRPVADFVADVMNRVLKAYGGVTEVEFAFADDESQDPTVVYQRNVAYVAAGIMGVNEARESSGIEPYDFETPPFRDTSSGPQLLEKLIEDLQNPPEPPPGLMPPNMPPADGGPGPAPADVTPPAANDAVPTADEPTAQEKAWAAAFTKYRAAVAADVATWKRVCMKRAREGRQPKLTFKSNVIIGRFRRDIATNLGAWEKSAPRPQDVHAVFDSIGNFYRLNKGELKPTRARRKVEKAIVALIDGWLRKLEPKVIAWGIARLLPYEQKDAVDFSAGDLAGDLEEQLVAGGSVGASEAALAIGVNLERVPPEVITYARQRAGELVGKHFVDGQWQDLTTGNAISETLRNLVNGAVSRAIEEKWTPAELASTLKQYFEISRAQTIARTETGFAYGNGAAELYKAEGIDQVNVVDGPGCLPFGHDDNAPQPDDAPGTVQAEAQADGQVWTVGEYQSAVLGHPNCVRVATPYFAEEK